MKIKVVYLFTLWILAVPAATFGQSGGDCILYERADRQGAFKKMTGDSVDPQKSSFATTSASGLGAIKSIWLRRGYAMELYHRVPFRGALTLLPSAATDLYGRYHHVADGTYVNLDEFHLQQPVASLRCREQGLPIANPGVCRHCVIYSFNHSQFTWRSGGNHPDHQRIEILDQGGVRILRAYEDRHYTIESNTFTLNLDSGEIAVVLTRDGGVKSKETLAWPEENTSWTSRLIYFGALKHVQSILNAVAEGNDQEYFVEPPKPELQGMNILLNTVAATVAY